MTHERNQEYGHAHPVNMGLGDVIRRLMHIEWQGRHTGLSPDVRSERDMLLEALNVIPVVVGFDCNDDGKIDYGVGIFAQAASTSCCRLTTPGGDNSRLPPPSTQTSSTSRLVSQDEPIPRKKGVLGNLFGSKNNG